MSEITVSPVLGNILIICTCIVMLAWAAAGIGMIPRPLLPVSRSVGNAAAAGAAMLLLDVGRRKTAEHIAQCTHTVQTADVPGFADLFCDNLSLS